MLIELWERLRGYGKWVETEATIESAQQRIAMEYRDPSDPPGKSRYTWKMEDVLTWSDAAGQRHQAHFTAHEESPLFKLTAGAKLIIRCDPANPARFYSREIHKAELRHFIQVTLSVIGVVVLCVGYIFVREFLGCGR
jgi:Protein of unknown function (DUF3592)